MLRQFTDRLKAHHVLHREFKPTLLGTRAHLQAPDGIAAQFKEIVIRSNFGNVQDFRPDFSQQDFRWGDRGHILCFGEPDSRIWFGKRLAI